MYEKKSKVQRRKCKDESRKTKVESRKTKDERPTTSLRGTKQPHPNTKLEQSLLSFLHAPSLRGTKQPHYF